MGLGAYRYNRNGKNQAIRQDLKVEPVLIMSNEKQHPLWQPSVSRIADANLTHFANYFRSTSLPDLGPTYGDLHRASLHHPGPFWSCVWKFCDLEGDAGDPTTIPSEKMTDWKWFPEARINFAEALIKPKKLDQVTFAESIALIGVNEQGEQTIVSRSQLFEEVCRVANFLKSKGIQKGDRVVAVIPNIPEAVIAFLATTAIGAIWSSCSPEFGEDAISDRFGQIEPRLIFTSSETQYNGKTIRPIAKVSGVLPRLRSIETIVVVGGSTIEGTSIEQCSWEEVLNNSPSSFEWERFPFDHPLCIVYSSGTTGVPKCIVHGIGGTLLQHLKEHSLHCDLKAGDRLFYYTTTGWMMWNWLVSGLSSEASLLLYDGSPLAPDPKMLWRLASELKVSHFGASARYYATLEKENVVPNQHFDLSRLRCVMSTGSPLLPSSYDWIYRSVHHDVNLASISGGTDILSCFVLGNPTLPVYAGQIQCKGLGMDVRIYDERGASIQGTPGELVCASPFPSMPIYFWNDPDNKKYKAAYFETYDNTWCHGDWAEETAEGGFIIYGRSDATLNPSGVRIGTAEIYQQIDSFPEISESLATVLRGDGDEQIILFLKMAANQPLTSALIEQIRKRLKERCSPRHVPKYIAAAADFPRTMSGKLSEIAVRSALSGKSLGNAGALSNPESLEFFRNWRPGDEEM